MHIAEYASVFHDSRENNFTPPDADDSLEHQADRWSGIFGHALLEHMHSNEPDTLDTDTLDAYVHWSRNNVAAIQSAPLSNAPGAQALQFHGLNGVMFDMWRPIAKDGWESDGHRRFYLRQAQDIMAFRGLELYIQKLRIIQELEKSGQNYFSNESTPLRKRVEGKIHEYDAGVVLLGIAEIFEGANVVAGPKQFENGAHSEKYGADYVFMLEDQAVGIQVKSTVTNADVENYDLSRVVLLDGRIDMGNEKMARIDATSSKLSHVSWAGLISASHVMEIPVKGHQNVSVNMGRVGKPRRTIMQYKMHAREALRGIKPHNQLAQQVIGRRIIDALYEDEDEA